MVFQLGHILVGIGILAIVHAGYSAVQYRTYLKLIEEEFTNLPIDIILQCFIGLIVGVIGAIRIAGDFKEIRAAAELQNKSWETFGNRPSFYSFEHRARAMFKEIMPQS